MIDRFVLMFLTWYIPMKEEQSKVKDIFCHQVKDASFRSAPLVNQMIQVQSGIDLINLHCIHFAIFKTINQS